MDLLAQMATFVRIVEGRSLSAAARGQGVSLPAVSRQLRALEEDLGTSLVLRSTRQLRITEPGRRWYEHCVRVLREVEDARASVRSTTSVRGALVVSASFSFGSILLAPRLKPLLDAYPELTIDLRLEDHLVDLIGEGVDVAIRAGAPPPDSASFVAHALSTMERVLVASPAYLRKNGIPRLPEQLARHECLLQVTPAGASVRWRLRPGSGAAAEQTVEVRGRLRMTTPIVLRDRAIEGAGIAYLPDWLVAPEIERGALRRVLPEWGSPPIQAWAVHRAELRGAPRLRVLLEALRGDRVVPEVRSRRKGR